MTFSTSPYRDRPDRAGKQTEASERGKITLIQEPPRGHKSFYRENRVSNVGGQAVSIQAA